MLYDMTSSGAYADSEALGLDAKHSGYMRVALELVHDVLSIEGLQLTCHYVQAEQALASDEVPVGCVLVHQDQIIGRAMNDTNRSLNVCALRIKD